jgi:hypothetical protein
MSRIITQSMEGGHLFRWGTNLGINGNPQVITAAADGIPQLDGSRVLDTGPFDGSKSMPLTLNGSGAAVTPTELYCGFFFLSSDPSSSANPVIGGSPDIAKHRLMSFWSGGTGICTVHIDPITQKLELCTGAFYWIDVFYTAVGTALTSVATSTQGQSLIANTVYHCQIHVKLAGASSVVEVKLDDTLVISWTGTLAGTTMDRVMTHSAAASYAGTNGHLYLATIIINDSTPDATCGNDTWTGVRRLKLQTITGPGFYSQFTPDPVQANYLNVQEVPNDGGTTVNYALSAGLKDSFPVSPNGLNALQITYKGWFEEVIANKTGGTFTIELGVRRAGTVYMSGVPLPLGVSFDVYDAWRCLDPSSLTAWTSAALDATEIIYQSD